jgi:hypothetical protein
MSVNSQSPPAGLTGSAVPGASAHPFAATGCCFATRAWYA